MFVYYNGKMSVCLSVTRVVFAQTTATATATATAVINGLLESMFHLVSEKLTLVDGVTPNYPKFGAEWGVVAAKPKFCVHFFDSRENYARYRQNCNETLLES